MKPVVWGVLSTAKIGMEKVLPGMRASPLIELRAIASRSLASAQAAAGKLGIPRWSLPALGALLIVHYSLVTVS